MLIRYYGLRKEVHNALDIIDAESDASITSHMISNGISICDSKEIALELFERSVKLDICDISIFTSTAQVCLSKGDYRTAVHILDRMVRQGSSFNKFSLSVFINACLEWQRAEPDPALGPKFSPAVQLLISKLGIVKETNPGLLTGAVCQKVIKELNRLHQPVAACVIHLGNIETLY